MIYLKVFAIAAVALMISFNSATLLEPSNAPLMAEYQQKLSELKAKPDATEQEMAELEAMFRQINSAKNIEAELKELVIKNGIFYALLFPLTLLAALKLTMSNNGVLASAALIFLAFILGGFVISGALFGAVFAMAGLSKNQRALRAAS